METVPAAKCAEQPASVWPKSNAPRRPVQTIRCATKDGVSREAAEPCLAETRKCAALAFAQMKPAWEKPVRVERA
jgi:hypothetical protein